MSKYIDLEGRRAIHAPPFIEPHNHQISGTILQENIRPSKAEATLYKAGLGLSELKKMNSKKVKYGGVRVPAVPTI